MRNALLVILGLVLSFCAFGQDTTEASPPPLISGSADLYYRYDFNDNSTDNKTSFTNAQNNFELGMFSVKIQHAFGKVSVTGDLGFGKRAREFSYNDDGITAAVKQLYLTYQALPWLKLTAGSFATFVGYESMDANLNRNYSMSYLFSYGPFFHTGLKAEVTLGENTLMAGVFNPTDYKYAPEGSKKYFGAQWVFAPTRVPFSSTLNYIGGTDTAGVRNDQVDLVLSYRFSKYFNLVYDGSVSHYGGKAPDGHWWGSAVYLQADPGKAWGLTLRGEYFSDPDCLKLFSDPLAYPGGGHVLSFTLSGSYKINGLTLIPEIRLDHASGNVFSKDGHGVPNMPSILAAAVYHF